MSLSREALTKCIAASNIGNIVALEDTVNGRGHTATLCSVETRNNEQALF
jgi:hypothetical protein